MPGKNWKVKKTMDGKNSLMKTWILTALLATGALLVVASGASAQGTTLLPCQSTPGNSLLTIQLSSAKNHIAPIVGGEDLTATVTYTYPQGGASVSPVVVTVTAISNQPSYTLVAVDNSQVTVPVPANQQASNGDTIPIPVKVRVQFTKDAPAFQNVQITLKARASAGDCIKEVGEVASAPATAQPAFYSKFTARLDQTIVKTGQNSRVALPVVLENFGNGQIITTFTVPEDVAKKIKLDVVLPADAVVESKIAGGSTSEKRINLELQTPFKNGYENRVDNLRIQIDSRSFDDQTIKGNPATISALVRTQGVYVPGFDVPLALVAVALAGVLAFRTRDEE